MEGCAVSQVGDICGKICATGNDRRTVGWEINIKINQGHENVNL